MKKFIIAVFTALALAAWVVPSVALDTVFDGQFRVRAIYINNAAATSLAGAKDASSWVDQRYRLGVKTTEGSITAYLQLQIGDRSTSSPAGNSKVWGADNGATNGTTSAANGPGGANNAGFDAIQVRQAWIQFPTGPITVKLGRTYVAHGFLGNGLFDNIVDRYAFSYKVDGNTEVSFVHAKPLEAKTAGAASTAANDGDRNVYNLGFTHKMGDMGDAAARVYYVRDGARGYTGAGASSAGGQFNGTWLTAQANLKFNPINVYISGAYLTGDARDSSSVKRDIDAYAAHLDVNSNVGPAKVGLIGGYGSGDKNTGDNKLKTFFAPGPASYVHTALFFQSSQPQNNDGLGSVGADMGSNQLNTQNGSRQTLSNVQWAGLYGDFKATDDLTLSALAAKFKQAQALAGQSKDIGAEFDLVANYKLQKGLALVGTAARFWPGEAFSNKVVTNENISLLFARLQWDF